MRLSAAHAKNPSGTLGEPCGGRGGARGGWRRAAKGAGGKDDDAGAAWTGAGRRGARLLVNGVRAARQHHHVRLVLQDAVLRPWETRVTKGAQVPSAARAAVAAGGPRHVAVARQHDGQHAHLADPAPDELRVLAPIVKHHHRLVVSHVEQRRHRPRESRPAPTGPPLRPEETRRRIDVQRSDLRL